jgi:hypothetical protein
MAGPVDQCHGINLLGDRVIALVAQDSKVDVEVS